MHYILQALFAVLLGIGLFAHTTPAAYAVDMGIAAVVNDDAISQADLNDRMNLIIISSRLPNTAETRSKLGPQILASLVDEQLRLQESQRLELDVTQGEINNGFATIAQQNGTTLPEFQKALTQAGIPLSTMERQIKAQIAWSKVVQKSLRSKVIVSDSDIDNVLERLHDSEGKSEYLVAEIFLPVEKPKQNNQVQALAQELAQKARVEKGSFPRLAQQFSKAPGAPQGGTIGWVQEDQLAEELDSVLVKMHKDEISKPIRTLTGYHIISLRDVRVIGTNTIPSRDEIMASLGLERLERLQQRHLLDLKSSAFIEERFEF